MQDDEARRRAICERIRERYREREWYGPDCDNTGGEEETFYSPEPLTTAELERWLGIRGCPYEVSYDADSEMYTVTIDRSHDPRLRRFEYPPAPEEQLRATEEALGYLLPAMLHLLYSEIANGGFGPAYGIVGVKGGWTLQDDGHNQTIDQDTEWRAPHDTREAIEIETLDRDPTRRFETTLPAHLRPAHFVAICYDGCGNDHCVDLATGRVYYAGCGGGEGDGQGHWPLFVVREALSVEQWLEDWLDDKKPEWLRTAEREWLAEDSGSVDTPADS